MEELYSLDSELTFTWLGLEHVAALALIVIMNWLVFFGRDRVKQQVRVRMRLTLAVLLLGQEILLQIWEISTGIWSIHNSLPLQLCSMSLLLTVFMLWSGSRKVYEVVYFWGMAGATQALLTPDIYYGFPHFSFLQFFTAHGLIVTGCWWMTVVEGYRPNIRALIKAFLATNVYAILVGIFNKLSGSNYLYLCQKPAQPSLLDLLGPWPWYILSLEGIALALFFIALQMGQGDGSFVPKSQARVNIFFIFLQ